MIALVYADREKPRCDDAGHEWMEEGFPVYGTILIRKVCRFCHEKGSVIGSAPAPRLPYPFKIPSHREQH